MASARPGGDGSVSLPQVIVILMGVDVTLLSVLFVFTITIGAVSGFRATATLLIPALIFSPSLSWRLRLRLTPFGLLLATLVSGGALGYLLVEREDFREENAAEPVRGERS